MRFQTAIRVAVYTAITFVSTVLLVVETPATGGYFNLGEAAIYAIAAMSPPIVAAIAGGLGPAIADLILGYWYFSPATFVIKFCEGYIVSRLIHVARSRGTVPTPLRLATPLVGIALAAIVSLNAIGGSGEEATGFVFTWTPTSVFGLTIPIPSFTLSLPSATWIAIGILIAGLSIAISFVSRARPYLLPMTIGGMIMVTGYFLYEFFVSNPLILHRDPWGAITEVPVNVGQFTSGILLAYPVVQFVERAKGARTAKTLSS